MSSVPDKEHALMQSQQYDYLSKSYTVTLPADMPHSYLSRYIKSEWSGASPHHGKDPIATGEIILKTL